MKKKCIVLLLLASTFALAQGSNESASREDILRFLDAMQIQKQMENLQQTMYSQMESQLDPMLDRMLANGSRPVSQGERAVLKRFMEESLQEAQNSYPVAQIIQDILPVYQKYLTKSEVNAVVDFYSSPAGKELLAKNPMMAKEAMAVMMPKMQQRIAAMTARMQERAEEMKLELQKKQRQLPSSLSGSNP